MECLLNKIKSQPPITELFSLELTESASTGTKGQSYLVVLNSYKALHFYINVLQTSG